MNKHVGYKILASVALCLLLGMTAIAFYFTSEQERSILEQNERVLANLTETTAKSVQTIMLAGYADIAQSFADNLKQVPGITDFRILHREGYEAFRQNSTIDSVNRRIGDEEFVPRDEEEEVTILSSQQSMFVQAKESLQTVFYYETSESGEPLLTFLTPLENQKDCQQCHGSDHKVRGVIKLTTTLDAVNREIRNTWIGLIVAIFVISAVIILVVGWMVRRISLPILNVAQTMDEISHGDGDLTVSLLVKGQDEIAALSLGFNTFVAKIRGTMIEVAGSTASLNELAEQVQGVSAKTRKAAERQQHDSDRVASAVTQLASTVEEVAASAENALVEARNVDEAAAEGKLEVDHTIETIHQLKERVESSNTAMAGLDDDMDHIGSILEMIQGIAEQTNLLALNAAIEAARAGDHGRGFSVVADEVRNLANRTQASTKEIQSFVDKLQKNSSNVVFMMRECLEQAEAGMTQADRSGESLERITIAGKQIVGINTAIASSMVENASVVEEINQAVVSISQESQNTAENAQFGYQRSKELTLLAETLEQLINQFKV